MPPSPPAPALLALLQVPDCCPWVLFVLQQFLQTAGFLKTVVLFCLRVSLPVCVAFAEKTDKRTWPNPSQNWMGAERFISKLQC